MSKPILTTSSLESAMKAAIAFSKRHPRTATFVHETSTREYRVSKELIEPGRTLKLSYLNGQNVQLGTVQEEDGA